MTTAPDPLRIGIVGGIFGHPADYRSRVSWTPETVLVEGLRARGHAVEAIGHQDRFDLADFDVVHVHHLSWGAVRAATSRSRVPFAFTLHQSSAARPTAAGFVMARADGIVALWPGEATALADSYHLDGAETRVIPNGVDPDVFPFRQPESSAGRPWRLLFVGQLIAGKGVDLLLEAVAELRRGAMALELELAYHASTEEGRLRARTRELGLDDVVRFLGPIPQRELSATYLAAHIVVLPSRSEALPSALTEAMLSGRYPVATDVGGVRDQVGHYGVVVPRASVSQIAQGIRHAVETYDAHCDRARAMRTYAEGRFSLEAMVGAHERLYQDLARGQVAPRRLRGTRTFGTVLARVPLDLRMRRIRAGA